MHSFVFLKGFGLNADYCPSQYFFMNYIIKRYDKSFTVMNGNNLFYTSVTEAA